MQNRNNPIQIIYYSMKVFLFLVTYFIFIFFNNSNSNMNEVKKYIYMYVVFAIIILLICLMYGVIIWLSVTYVVGDDYIETRKNMIFYKNTKKIMFKDVSIFDTSQNLFDKVFEVSSLSIDSSSSMTTKKADIILRLKVCQIKKLKLIIEEFNTTDKTINTLDYEEQKNTFNYDTIYQISKKDYFLNIIISLFTPIQFINIFFILPVTLLSEEISIFMILYLVFVLIVPLLRSINDLYNYNIKIDNEQILINYGLIIKRVGNIKLDKIKSINITKARIFKRTNLEAQVVGTVGSQSSESQGLCYDRIMVYVKKEMIDKIKEKLMLTTNTIPQKEISIPKISILFDNLTCFCREIILFIICYKIISTEFIKTKILFSFEQMISIVILIIIITCISCIYSSIVHYRVSKIKVYDNKIHFIKGYIFCSDQMINYEDIQNIKIKSNIIKRAFGVVTIVITPFKTSSYVYKVQIRNIKLEDSKTIIKHYLKHENDKEN